jgi:hypothetical protein
MTNFIPPAQLQGVASGFADVLVAANRFMSQAHKSCSVQASSAKAWLDIPPANSVRIAHDWKHKGFTVKRRCSPLPALWSIL